MIDQCDIETIYRRVDEYWTQTLKKEGQSFFDIASGKEGGHQLSDRVDQLTTEIIHSSFPMRSGFQHTKGRANSRSMGDIWFRNGNGEWNPVNVKTGLVGSEGQPNIVSLKRVMSSIFEHSIDSYYLLFVKFAIDAAGKSISHHVYFVDLLDWIVLSGKKSVVTFNAGPGQMMLRASRFFDLLSDGFQPKVSPIRAKVKALMDLYLLGERNLIRDRQKDRKKYKAVYDGFMKERQPFSIDINRQMEFEIR